MTGHAYRGPREVDMRVVKKDTGGFKIVFKKDK